MLIWTNLTCVLANDGIHLTKQSKPMSILQIHVDGYFLIGVIKFGVVMANKDEHLANRLWHRHPQAFALV